MTGSMRSVLKMFIRLIDQYISKEVDANTFEKKYSELWRKYRDTSEYLEINKKSNNAIDRIFTALDCYCSDPDLRDDNDLDEEGLFAEVSVILEELKMVNLCGHPQDG